MTPDEVLDDPVLEERARNLSTILRCLVCQNQSIDESDAPLAKDLRILVRERLVTGDSDEEVVNFLVSKYGEFILLKPKLNTHTFILWVFAPAILILGLLAIFFAYRRRSAQKYPDIPAKLTAKESEKLRELLTKRESD